MNDHETVIRNLILDMDGVLWRGETPMDGLVEFFAAVRKLGLGFILATNNATKTAVQYEQKLAGFGLAIPPAQILTSAEATAAYLRQHYPAETKVYIVGEDGLHQAMASQGFSILPVDGFVGNGAAAELVVVGFNRYVCYADLASATYLINNGARFIATNPDVTIPSEYGPLPGAGSLLALLKTATGVEPEVVGKPNRRVFREAMQRLGGTAGDTVMVGDRLSTDIAGGQAAGLRTILLLSGISTLEDVAESGIRPDWIFDDLAALTQALHNELPIRPQPAPRVGRTGRLAGVIMDEPINIYDLQLSELEALLVELGQPSYRVNQLWQWLYQRFAADFDEMTNLPQDLRQALAKRVVIGNLVPVLEQDSQDGQTRKVLFQLPDGNYIETVRMRYDKRITLCISTQAGCAMGCVFCATGQMGFFRNLSAGEIVSQVLFLARELAR